MNKVIVTTLGSVSPYSKGNMNCPGYMVECGNDKVLLDCGSGITRNMNMANVLENLKIIISHLHRDHYSDLFSIAYASFVYHKLGLLKNRVDVYLPITDKVERKVYTHDDNNWLKFSTIQEEISDVTFLKNFGDEHFINFKYYDDTSNIELEKMNISFIQTNHNITNYAARLECGEKTICYSGDTGFADYLYYFFASSDLLICESSFLKGQKREENNHLYAYEAAKIAYEAKVKKLMLTHFWPELDKSLYLEEAKKTFKNTIVAEEGKRLILK